MEAGQASFNSSAEPSTTSNDGQAGLTATESRLLAVLRGQPGRLFSRAELVALVMPDSVVLERTIDVHVKALRQKLGPLGRRIETVRKGGYRFAAEPERTEGSPS